MAEVIAELATNHGGDLDLAARMIQDAKRCGADWVKFQAYQTKFLRPDDPQFDWFKQCELSDEALYRLKGVCDSEGIKFLATVYDPERVPVLHQIQPEAIKIGSGEGRDDAIRSAANRIRFDRVFVGCGIFAYPFDGLFDSVPLVGVPAYPCESHHALIAIADAAVIAANERVDEWGYSDHTDHSFESSACVVARALGASVFEVHVALAGTTRRLACDRDAEQLEMLCDGVHCDDTELPLRTHLMLVRARAEKRFVGRWSHGR